MRQKMFITLAQLSKAVTPPLQLSFLTFATMFAIKGAAKTADADW